MTSVATALIQAVHAAGGTITLDGPNLQLEAPTPLPEALRASLRQHKPALVTFLAEQAANANIPAPPLPDAPGPWSAGIPDYVARGIITMASTSAPEIIPARAWPTIVADSLALVDSGLAAQAFALGWSAADLFGCDQRAPWHRLDRAGLMLLVDGRTIPELTAAHAALRHRDGSVLRFRRRLVPHEPPVAMLWHLLPKRLRPAVGPAP